MPTLCVKTIRVNMTVTACPVICRRCSRDFCAIKYLLILLRLCFYFFHFVACLVFVVAVETVRIMIFDFSFRTIHNLLKIFLLSFGRKFKFLNFTLISDV